MVRVGGGWCALDEFLVKNDPCRGKYNSVQYASSLSFSRKTIDNNHINERPIMLLKCVKCLNLVTKIIFASTHIGIYYLLCFIDLRVLSVYQFVENSV